MIFGRPKKTVRAKLLCIHSSSILDLENWAPGRDFEVHIQIFVGPVEGPGEESFDVTVCSPSRFAERLVQEEIRSGHHTIFMHEYSYRKLYSFLERAIHRVEASSWSELAEKLSWLGHWEFAGYSERPD